MNIRYAVDVMKQRAGTKTQQLVWSRWRQTIDISGAQEVHSASTTGCLNEVHNLTLNCLNLLVRPFKPVALIALKYDVYTNNEGSLSVQNAHFRKIWNN